MRTVNMLEAKTQLSKLVEAVESGDESEIVIARNGRPAAKLVPVSVAPVGKRTGIAKGKYVIPEDIDQDNETIADLFGSR